jgi:hypothetical protein
VLPTHNPHRVAVPAVHWNVTVDEFRTEPLAGLVIAAGVDTEAV